MENLVEQIKVEREVFEKAQNEQEVMRERRKTTAAVQIQTLFRGYWYDTFTYCCQQLSDCNCD